MSLSKMYLFLFWYIHCEDIYIVHISGGSCVLYIYSITCLFLLLPFYSCQTSPFPLLFSYGNLVTVFLRTTSLYVAKLTIRRIISVFHFLAPVDSLELHFQSSVIGFLGVQFLSSYEFININSNTIWQPLPYEDYNLRG